MAGYLSKARKCRAPFDAFRARITSSSTWDELYRVLRDADVAVVLNNALTFDDIDRLCDVARARALQLPQHAEERMA